MDTVKRLSLLDELSEYYKAVEIFNKNMVDSKKALNGMHDAIDLVISLKKECPNYLKDYEDESCCSNPMPFDELMEVLQGHIYMAEAFYYGHKNGFHGHHSTSNISNGIRPLEAILKDLGWEEAL